MNCYRFKNFRILILRKNVLGLTFATLLLFLIGCKKDLDTEKSPSITIAESEFTVDYHYQPEVLIKFTATANWEASITYENSSQSGWLALTLSEGISGTDATLTMQVDINSVLTNRKAYITIICASRSYKLTFTQKGFIETDLTAFFDTDFASELQKREIIPNAKKIMRSDVINERAIDVRDGSLTSVLGIEHFETLGLFWCSNNQLATLDISKNIGLSLLDCANNRLSSIDVSNNENLMFLYCSQNQFVTLDISKNRRLQQFDCASNPGNGVELIVRSWFYRQYVSASGGFTLKPWIYNGQTIAIKYQKID